MKCASEWFIPKTKKILEQTAVPALRTDLLSNIVIMKKIQYNT